MENGKEERERRKGRRNGKEEESAYSTQSRRERGEEERRKGTRKEEWKGTKCIPQASKSTISHVGLRGVSIQTKSPGSNLTSKPTTFVAKSSLYHKFNALCVTI